MSRVILNEWLSFYSTFFFFFFLFTEVLHLQRYLVVTWLVPRQTAAVSAHVLCTSYNRAPAYSVTSFGATYRVHVCLAVTCHLLFRRNDRGLLRATAVTRGWSGYRNKSQHRKLTLQKKILPPLLRGLEPATFRSRIRRCNH